MIVPTIPEQIEALRITALSERTPSASPPSIESIRRAEVLDFIRNRIEVFANKARLQRGEGPQPGDVEITDAPTPPL